MSQIGATPSAESPGIRPSKLCGNLEAAVAASSKLRPSQSEWSYLQTLFSCHLDSQNLFPCHRNTSSTAIDPILELLQRPLEIADD